MRMLLAFFGFLFMVSVAIEEVHLASWKTASDMEVPFNTTGTINNLVIRRMSSGIMLHVDSPVSHRETVPLLTSTTIEVLKKAEYG